MQITPLRRADVPELSQFLTKGISVSATSPLFSPEVLSWKYFDGPGGPAGDSGSSLVARSGGRIIGHIGMCFRQLIVPGDGAAAVPTMHAMDWLSSPTHPGSGVLLMLRACATSPTQFAVGGTPEARAIFPSLGFEQKPGVASFVKRLKPSHRLRAPGEGVVRKWVGTAKDVAFAWLARTPPVSQAVELRSVPTFTEEIDCLQRPHSQHVVTCRRDHVLLNSLLRCPVSGFSGWTIHASQRMIGFAVLKVTAHGRTRIGIIVDCWLNTADPSFWQAAVAALNDRLRALSTYYVRAYAITPSLHAALLLNGFTRLDEVNVYVRDKQRLLPRDAHFGLSRLDVEGAIHFE
ncbi:hypothetical protein [Frigoriglobus tundricola]|uniref:Uncharacterized protein n=1 Tax=Frigoriglobus tundricola TaxID=2774151 RepID=A0A6M5YPE9_9BACT|nr:hypothetical protein [Frigoriglobus tundricola]QJW95163.1 hypothetical protein FTUN_2702 [Frigoriglobus tundricola]